MAFAMDDTFRMRPFTGRAWFADEHFVRHRAQRVDVGAPIHLSVARGLLGAHVLRRAEADPRLGHALTAGLRDRERDAKVGNHRLAGMQLHVLGLEIPMDHASLVRIVERPAKVRAKRTASSTGNYCSRSSRARSVSPSTNGMT